MMRSVQLAGELGRRFGRRHRLNVASVAEAIRALCANFPGFDRYLVESGEHGVGYRVLIGGTAIERDEEVCFPVGQGDVRLVPVIAGSKRGIGAILMGAALIALSFATGGAAAGTFLAYVSTAAGNIGFAMALSGVAQLLSPSPKFPGPNERPEEEPSYLFDGPVNTVNQGQPVPVCYGEMTCGSAVISGGIVVEEIPAT